MSIFEQAWLGSALGAPLSAILAVGTMVYTVMVWKSRKGSIWERIH